MELVIAIELETELLSTRAWMKRSGRSQRFIERVVDIARSLRPTAGTDRVQKSPVESRTLDMFGYTTGTKKQTSSWGWAGPAADRLVFHVEHQPGAPKDGIAVQTRNQWTRQLADLGLNLFALERIIEWLFKENLDSEFPFVVRSGKALKAKLPNILAVMERSNGAVRKRHSKPKAPSESQKDQREALDDEALQTQREALEHQYHDTPDPECVRCRLALERG